MKYENEVCKHGKFHRQCLHCAIHDMYIEKQIRDWQIAFALASGAGIPRTKKRWKDEYLNNKKEKPT